ncbi:hypothetical protein [Candidatus Uabimicrobium amorphum]|uniref:Uncharacterized protein n=1 Tax=Uabimicrobium amorphum TaxID=2596890 RepID=A0A5S9F183_UABAM|nr:hypothetical protein [Candidatus Uabimicrobium amorphum]BBM81931.1 hypothetical protein UABAM_00274 [Candidatus Uabimicrobium amorphum]
MEFLQDSLSKVKKNPTDFIAVLGAKGSGKTLLTTAIISSIIDGLVPDMTGTVSEGTHEFLNRHLIPIRQKKQWPEPTRGWHDLNLSLRWETPKKIRDYKIQFQDIQGSDFETGDSELVQRMYDARAYFFVVSPKHLLTENELRHAAGDNAYLESIIPEEGRFARQMNWNYSQMLEKIITSHHIEGHDGKISRPISVIFTRKDDYPNLEIETLKHKFQGTFKWFQAHARYVEYFFVSSVGKTVAPDPEQDAKTKQIFIHQYGEDYNIDLPAKKSPPAEISPEGVIDPITFVLQAFAFESTRVLRQRIQISSIAAGAVLALFVIWSAVSWLYNYNLSMQMRSESAKILNNFIRENETQEKEIYQKIGNYVDTYGSDHKEGKEFLAKQTRIRSKVQAEWLDEVSQQARENDQDDKSVRDYQEACRSIEEYLRSGFPEGKKYLHDMLERLEKRIVLAKTLENYQQSYLHADYRHALSILDEYLKRHSFQRSRLMEKRKKLQRVYSAFLYKQALEQGKIYNTRAKLEDKIIALESFLKKERMNFISEDLQKLESEIWELRAQQAHRESKEAFDKRDYKNAQRILKNFERLEGIPENIRKNIRQELQQLYAQEYQQELNLALQFQGKECLDALANFQDKYIHHSAFDKNSLLNKVCLALAEVAKEVQQNGSWEQGIASFNHEEQRFPNVINETAFWKLFLPVIQGRIFKLAELKNYESAWSLLKIYDIKLSGQIRLKKYALELQEWSQKLAQRELEDKWKSILIEENDVKAIRDLERFRRYSNQPTTMSIYRSEYKEKVDEKRFQLCIQQYEVAVAKKDFAQGRLILEQYEGWGAEKYATRIFDMKENIDKQEIMVFWNSALTKIEDDFLTTTQKLEALQEFQRLHRERPGYKNVEEDVEVLAKSMTDNLKDEHKNQVTAQIERAFEDETALPKAQEAYEKYQKEYPGDNALTNFQAQIHEAKISWSRRHLQDCEDMFDPQKKHEAFEQYLRKYSTNRYLYRELLHKAEKGKKAAALEWDRREFQKADSAWRSFQYRADEFSAAEGRKRIEEISRLYTEYSKHWGPEKQFIEESKEQILFLRQLLNGARYTLKLQSGKFAKNYWVYNPSVKVSIKVGSVTYPFTVYKDKQKVTWDETKEIYWKAYETVSLEIVDNDKKSKNVLLTHKEVGCFSLIKFCTVEDRQEKKMVPQRTISNKNNSINFELVSSNVATINQWYSIKGKASGDK